MATPTMNLKLHHYWIEYMIILFFITQVIYPEKFTFTTSFLLFFVLLIIKYFIEGCRISTILIFLSQILLSSISWNPIRYIALILGIVSNVAFPSYKYPPTQGKYKVGYRKLFKGPLRAAVFYPTDEVTHDIHYYPHDEHWQRFYEIMKLGEIISQGKSKYPIPKWFHKVVLSQLETKDMGVQVNARIVKNPDGGFPLMLYSHGLSANRHCYSLLLKEWASRGFICVSFEHDENVLIKIKTYQDAITIRKSQLEDRKQVVKNILDMFTDIKAAREILEEPNLEIDFNKVFCGGHSFGGATTAETCFNDKRITGGAVMMDPWFEPCHENIYSRSLDLPILSLRSHSFEKIKLMKELNLKMKEANQKDKENIIFGYFENSTHNCTADTPLLMPRELHIFGMIPSLESISLQYVNHLQLSIYFLEECLRRIDQGKKSNEIKQRALKKFKEFLKEKNIQDTLKLDE